MLTNQLQEYLWLMGLDSEIVDDTFNDPYLKVTNSHGDELHITTLRVNESTVDPVVTSAIFLNDTTKQTAGVRRNVTGDFEKSEDYQSFLYGISKNLL